jgi:hypothetical protein
VVPLLITFWEYFQPPHSHAKRRVVCQNNEIGWREVRLGVLTADIIGTREEPRELEFAVGIVGAEALHGLADVALGIDS